MGRCCDAFASWLPLALVSTAKPGGWATENRRGVSLEVVSCVELMLKKVLLFDTACWPHQLVALAQQPPIANHPYLEASRLIASKISMARTQFLAFAPPSEFSVCFIP